MKHYGADDEKYPVGIQTFERIIKEGLSMLTRPTSYGKWHTMPLSFS